MPYEQIETNQEEYLNLLTYKRGILLLEDKNLIEYANMCPTSINIFPQLIEYRLKNKNYTNYQIIKTETRNQETYNYHFELKVKPNTYNKIRRMIFEIAYICCSNQTRTNLNTNWCGRELSLSTSLSISEDLYQGGLLHAIFPSTFEGYNIKTTNIRINEEDFQEQYQQFLLAPRAKTNQKKLIKK